MIRIIANAHTKGGMSGSDNIYINLSKHWGHHRTWTMLDIDFWPFWICYIWRIIWGCIKAAFDFGAYEFVYSASDFWMDSLPGFIMKLKGHKWVAGFYLFAPRPFSEISPYRGLNWLRGLIYYLTQRPIYHIIRRYADKICLTSHADVQWFPEGKTIVVRGGVDLPPIEYFPAKALLKGDRYYDAVFVGRLHYQKGAEILPFIWAKVCQTMPYARLAIIGVGPLEDNIRSDIKFCNMENNIVMLGYKNGDDKYAILRDAKVFLHPATYDNGGMAACEAMAWGLPAVGFDLCELRTYYPKGMLKTECFNIKEFADNITNLLIDDRLYDRLRREAIEWASEWDWKERAKYIMEQINA